MPQSDAVVVVSDAHLAPQRSEITRQFHRFLETVPDLASHLVINGDLFEFWFEYRSVVPRGAFPTLALLARLRQSGVRITVLGGNHDRWGGTFWRDQMDATFAPGSADLMLAGWQSVVLHGDEVGEDTFAGRLLHRLVRNRAAVGAFRWLHPDVGFALVDRLSGLLAGRRDDEELIRRATAAQARYARQLMDGRPELNLVVMGHTHRPVLESVGESRWYLNPGAWVEGSRYATITNAGPELRTFT